MPHDPYRSPFSLLPYSRACLSTTSRASRYRLVLTLGSSNDKVILQNREVLSIDAETFERHGGLLLLTLVKGQCCCDGCCGGEDDGTSNTNDEHMGKREESNRYHAVIHHQFSASKFAHLIPPIATLCVIGNPSSSYDGLWDARYHGAVRCSYHLVPTSEKTQTCRADGSDAWPLVSRNNATVKGKHGCDNVDV